MSVSPAEAALVDQVFIIPQEQSPLRHLRTVSCVNKNTEEALLILVVENDKCLRRRRRFQKIFSALLKELLKNIILPQHILFKDITEKTCLA